MDIDGGCHCGAVQYKARLNPKNVIICHCADCQIQSGAAFRTVASVRAETFELSGETRTYVRPADSGNQRATVFCPQCGTHVYGTSAGDEAGDGVKVIGIRVGTCNQRAELAPSRQIWCQSGLPWLADLSDVARSEQQ